MPLIYVRPQYTSQDGFNETGVNYVNEGNTYGASTSRVGIIRFNHVDVPKGSTINSATMNMVVSVKNVADAQSAQYRWFIEDTPTSTPLDRTANEWDGRGWWGGGPLESFAWTPNGPTRQRQVGNVKPQIERILSYSTWTRAGGPMTFLHAFAGVTQPDNMWFHLTEDGAAPLLAINYTPPASDGLETVVNLQENCNFSRQTYKNGAFSTEPYFLNTMFGTYGLTTYSYITTPAPPFGGAALKAVAYQTGAPPMVGLGNPRLEEGQWYNYSAYVYVPSSNPNPVRMGINNDKAWTAEMTTKNQWVRMDIPFLADNDVTWALINNHTTTTAGQGFYVANVQLTKGRVLRPYIDGNRTMTNAQYGWAGHTGTNGYVRAVKPTVGLPAVGDKSTYKMYPVDWNYFNSQGHTHVGAEIKVRKV